MWWKTRPHYPRSVVIWVSWFVVCYAISVVIIFVVSKYSVVRSIGSSSVKTVADRHRLAAYRNKHYWRAFRWCQHRWPWTTLNPKIWVLVNFSWFQTAIHILRVDCAKTIQDRPGQPAYGMFGIKRRLQWCKAWPPRFRESSMCTMCRVVVKGPGPCRQMQNAVIS